MTYSCICYVIVRIVGLQEQLLKVHLKWLSNLNFILSILPCPRLPVNLSCKPKHQLTMRRFGLFLFRLSFLLLLLFCFFFIQAPMCAPVLVSFAFIPLTLNLTGGGHLYTAYPTL